MTTPSLINVAWVLFEDPDPDTIVHRVDLITGRIVCADWISQNAGHRIADADIRNYGPRCILCWPEQES